MCNLMQMDRLRIASFGYLKKLQSRDFIFSGILHLLMDRDAIKKLPFVVDDAYAVLHSLTMSE